MSVTDDLMRRLYQQGAQRQYGALQQTSGATPMPPASPGQAPGYAQYSPISPGQNLIGTQILPTASPDTTAARAGVGQAYGALGTAPDRVALANQAFSELSRASEPQYQTDLRQIGEKASTLGRIGSGVTTTELGDLGLQRQKYLGNLQEQLATNAAGQTMSDRLNTLSAGQNVLGQFSGLDQQQYGNLLGERGYQQGLSQQAFGNEMSQNSLLASLGGFGGASPSDLYNQGGAGMQGGATLLQYLLQNMQKRAPMYGYSGSEASDGGYGTGYG